MNKTVEYIKETKGSFSEKKETTFYGRIPVHIISPLTAELSINDVLKKIESIIPRHLLVNVDMIYIGDFDFLKKKKINAAYADGALYILNEQDDASDLIDDIVHEIAHASEEIYGSEIYSDEEVKNEFLLKRKKLFEMLKAYDYVNAAYDFKNLEYDEAFDKFLYKELGYERLSFFIEDVFLSPYSVTSLKEYFGIGFEQYFLDDRKKLKRICPELYDKINYIANLSEE